MLVVGWDTMPNGGLALLVWPYCAQSVTTKEPVQNTNFTSGFRSYLQFLIIKNLRLEGECFSTSNTRVIY